MLQFQIVVNTLKVNDGSVTVFSISKKDVYYIQTSLNEAVPIILLYNLNVGVFSLVFKAPLSECLDPNGNPFTVNTFTDFAELNLGFNTGGASSSITVTDSYATLPAPATAVGEFYWCENADGTFPVGLYYSDGVTWQFQVADDITVVANYSALPSPATVNGQFFWAEASQGTSWLPANLGGTYYSAGMYYSNGVSWSFLNVPYQATQSEVNAGTNTDKFVTPSTLKNQDYLATITYADSKVENNLNASTTVAPSTTAVNNALALKQNALGYTPFRFVTTSQTAVTGTVAETVVATATILGNTYNATDYISLLARLTKPVTASNVTVRIKINTSNTIVGATQIATYTYITTNIFATLTRTFPLNSGTLNGFNFTSSNLTDTVASASLGSSTTFDTTVTNYLFFTVQLSNIADSITANLCSLTN